MKNYGRYNVVEIVELVVKQAADPYDDETISVPTGNYEGSRHENNGISTMVAMKGELVRVTYTPKMNGIAQSEKQEVALFATIDQAVEWASGKFRD